MGLGTTCVKVSPAEHTASIHRSVRHVLALHLLCARPPSGPGNHSNHQVEGLAHRELESTGRMARPHSKRLCALSHLTFTPVLEAGHLKLSPFPENYNRSSKHLCDIHSFDLRRPSWGRFCNATHCSGGKGVRIDSSWLGPRWCPGLVRGQAQGLAPHSNTEEDRARTSGSGAPEHHLSFHLLSGTASRPTPRTAHVLVALHGPRLLRTPRPRAPTS